MEQNKTDTHKYLCDYTNDLRKKGLPNDEIFHNLLAEGGKAVHVSGYMGEGLFLNESRIEKNGGRPRTLCELKAMYPSFLMVRRKLEEKQWA